MLVVRSPGKSGRVSVISVPRKVAAYPCHTVGKNQRDRKPIPDAEERDFLPPHIERHHGHAEDESSVPRQPSRRKRFAKRVLDEITPFFDKEKDLCPRDPEDDREERDRSCDVWVDVLPPQLSGENGVSQEEADPEHQAEAVDLDLSDMKKDGDHRSLEFWFCGEGMLTVMCSSVTGLMGAIVRRLTRMVKDKMFPPLCLEVGRLFMTKRLEDLLRRLQLEEPFPKLFLVHQP